MSLVSEVIGLGIGEETKGAWVEFLTHKTHATYVWRKGGPQSGHNIVLNDKVEITLSHFGAGVFQGATTFVDMPIIPTELFSEALALKEAGVFDPLSLIEIDAKCLVVTPYHQAISRLREILRSKKKGTIGLGVGEAIMDAKINPEVKIIALDMKMPREYLVQKIETTRRFYLSKAIALTCEKTDLPEEARPELELLRNTQLVDKIAESYNLLADMVSLRYEKDLDDMLEQNTVIECSHGAQLHPRFGYYPHVTKIDPVGLDAISRLTTHTFGGTLRRFGVFRSCSTRFGAGPLVVFDKEMSENNPEKHNYDNDWLGKFRKGPLDLVGIAYGVKICQEPPLSGLMISFMDSLRNKDSWPVCVAYRYRGQANDLADYFEIHGDLLTDIKLAPDDDSEKHLDHQHRLTELLENCEPVIEWLRPEDGKRLEDTLVTFIENRLRIPVCALAYGPKLTDRLILPGKEYLFQ